MLSANFNEGKLDLVAMEYGDVQLLRRCFPNLPMHTRGMVNKAYVITLDPSKYDKIAPSLPSEQPKVNLDEAFVKNLFDQLNVIQKLVTKKPEPNERLGCYD